MEKLKGYYSTFDIEARSEDEIFRDLCTDKEYKNLGQVTWKEAFVNLFGSMLKDIPDPRAITARLVNEGLVEKGLAEIDCENTYFNMFNSEVISDHRYNFDLIQSYRVTDACLMNVFGTLFEDWYQMQGFGRNGIYSIGKEGTYGKYPAVDPAGTTALWGPEEEVYETIVLGEIIRDHSIWDAFKTEFDTFWETYNDTYAELLADSFLASAISQYKRKTLSEEGFLMVRNAYYGREEDVQITLLDIYGYASTDIICIEQKGVPIPSVILYIPGGNNSFIEFLNLEDLKQWIAWHLQDNANMAAIRKHFSSKVRQDGTTYTGVDNVLKGIAEESSTWPAQEYILYRPTHLETNDLFNQIRDRAKQRMLDDGDAEIKSNSEATRDYALSIVETLISQLSMIDMLVPEIGIPINLALSATALGLSADIVINGDTYEERKYGVGSLVTSSLFTVINLIPVISDSATILKDFARATEELPTFITEEQFLASHFGLAEEDLETIAIGDSPRIPEGENPNQMRLVRLSNEDSPLAILRRVAANRYVRLNPFTLEEMEGSLISEVLDMETGKFHYLSNTGLIGGSPYNPFRLDMDSIWTPEVLKKKAYVIGKPIGQSYQRILEQLKLVHESETLDMRRSIAHELMESIDIYEAAHPTSGRLSAFQELRTQLEDALYLPDSPQLIAVKTHTLIFPNTGSGAANFLLDRAMKEMSSAGEEITADLIRFAKNDDVITSPFQGYTGEIPADINFHTKYVIQDITAFDGLATNYFELAEYVDLGMASNSEILRYALSESQNASLLTNCTIVDNSLYIGHSYEELYHSISSFVNGEDRVYPIHPLTIFNMIKEFQGESEMIELFATRNFFNETVINRLSSMENGILLSKDFDYTLFDNTFGESFANEFAEAEDTTARIDLCLAEHPGVITTMSENSVGLLLDNLEGFIEKGLTDIAVTGLYNDIAQSEIINFLTEQGEWHNLDSMLLNLDKGDLNGPYRRLLVAAKENDLNFTALSNSDNSISPFTTEYQFAYFKANIIKKAIEELDNAEKKFIIFTDYEIINSSEGIGRAQPGLSQYLKAPGTAVNSDGSWEFLPDLVEKRVAFEAEALDDWTTLAPEQGRILGLKQFKLEGGEFPTPTSRRLILENSVPDELKDEFFAKIDEITGDEIMQSIASSEVGSCDTVSRNIIERLREMGIETGNGATLTWWTREGGLNIGHDMHTTASFMFHGEEFVVDGSHLQILHDSLDDAIIILPINDWANEIAQRVRAINPFLSYRYRSGNALSLFMPPLFTKPRLKRPKQ